jgi:hypothetical protein
MLIVETIAKIRRAFFVQGKPIKAICRELSVSRKVVRKVIRSEAFAPALDGLTAAKGTIDGHCYLRAYAGNATKIRRLPAQPLCRRLDDHRRAARRRGLSKW